MEDYEVVSIETKKTLFKKDLENRFSEVLKKTDYVHTSEFLTDDEKTEILNYRQGLKQVYEAKKAEIEASASMSELCSIVLKIGE